MTKTNTYHKRLIANGFLKAAVLHTLIKKPKITGYIIWKEVNKKLGFDYDAGTIYNSLLSLISKKYIKKCSAHKKDAYVYQITSEGRKYFKVVNELFKNSQTW